MCLNTNFLFWFNLIYSVKHLSLILVPVIVLAVAAVHIQDPSPSHGPLGQGPEANPLSFHPLVDQSEPLHR